MSTENRTIFQKFFDGFLNNIFACFLMISTAF